MMRGAKRWLLALAAWSCASPPAPVRVTPAPVRVVPTPIRIDPAPPSAALVEPTPFVCPTLGAATGVAPATRWLTAGDHRGCCGYASTTEPLPAGWLEQSECVRASAPGLDRGPRRTPVITLEGRDLELDLVFARGQESLSDSQRAQLTDYAQQLRRLATPPPVLTPWVPEAASRPTRRRASELSHATAQFLLEQGVAAPEVESPVAAPKVATASVEWRLRLRTYLPRPPEPTPCRPGVTLQAPRLTATAALSAEICRNARCSRGSAHFGTAAALSFALRGPLTAVVYVERSADSQLLVEARATSAPNDLRSGDVYRFKLWDRDEAAPLQAGERVAHYDEPCPTAVLTFAE